MSEKTDNLKSLLQPFGLNEDESLVYLLLIENGPSTALQLSRKSKISRTKVYRLLDKLTKTGIVVQKVDDMGAKFIASSPKEFEKMLIEKEHEVNVMKEKMPIILKQIEGLQLTTSGDSKILYYKGIEGLKQVTWNSLKAKGELLTMEIKDLNAFLDHEYAEKVRQEVVSRGIKIRTVTNQHEIKPWTNVKEATHKDHWEIRFINPQALEIKFEVLLYNDVYCLYHYQNDEFFCVEIYNQELVNMQKQIFEFMWTNARPFVVLDEHGSAILGKNNIGML